MFKKYLPQVIILILLLGWYGFFICQKTNLTTADLGRHLKNGETILTNFNWQIFKTNFYSYTFPDYPFINHHWLSGVIFFLVWKLAGFTGLSIFFLLISFTAFVIFFLLAKKLSNNWTAFILSLLLIPLIAERKEIRPEIFSYLFSAVFLWTLWPASPSLGGHFNNNQFSLRRLFILPGLQLLWVNLHIYFILGPCLIGLFLLENLVRRAKNKAKKLTIILLTTTTVCLLNPLGLKTILYPLNIFKDYGYRIVENQSVWFLQKLDFFRNPNLLLFEIIFFLLILSSILLIIFNRQKVSLSFSVLAIVFSAAGWLALRNFAIFGLVALPITAYNFNSLFGEKFKMSKETATPIKIFLVLAVLLFIVANHNQQLSAGQQNFGLGLMPQNNASAEFFKNENIKGPIFNNYDVGSYLIFHLFPKEKVYPEKNRRVFVDNRPETYPTSFFEDVYISMQQNNEIWLEQNKKYEFNAIFFAYHDATPWGQKFLVERVQDPEWAPVFVDAYNIIFLKRNEQNQEIIKKYEIPKETFGYSSSL